MAEGKIVSAAFAELRAQAKLAGRRRKVWHVSTPDGEVQPLAALLNALQNDGHEIVSINTGVVVSWRWEITPAED